MPDLARFYAEGATQADIEALCAHLAGSFLAVVQEPETLRRGTRGPRKPVPGGFFCEVTFGPTGDQWALLDVGPVRHPSGAVVSRVPIPPPNERAMIPPEAPRMMSWEGPLNEALVALAERARRRARLEALGAPAQVQAREAELVQAAFDQVMAAAQGRAAATWPPQASTRMTVQPMRAPDVVAPHAAAIRALLFLSDTEILVQTANGGAVYNDLGRVVQRVPAAAPMASSVHGELVVFARGLGEALDHYSDRSPWLDAHAGAYVSFALWDRSNERLLDTVPAHAPRFVVDESDVERMGVMDACTGHTLMLRVGSSEPRFWASTRDGRFAWVGEREDNAVVELSTGIFFAEPPRGADGKGPAALALTPEGSWRFVTPSGKVGDHLGYFASIEGACSAVAFSPDGEWIALARGTRVEIRRADASLALLRAFDVTLS
jgi:hypothetical protein